MIEKTKVLTELLSSAMAVARDFDAEHGGMCGFGWMWQEERVGIHLTNDVLKQFAEEKKALVIVSEIDCEERPYELSILEDGVKYFAVCESPDWVRDHNEKLILKEAEA